MSSASSRSSPDPVALSLDAAASSLLGAITAVAASNPVVLIDGRSGAGKTSLAHRLIARWPLAGRVQLVALDSLYPGWDGLDQGVELAREQILMPHARGLVGVWQRWDWDAAAPAEAHAIDPSLPLVVEGSGLLTPLTAKLADVRVWMESPTPSRKHRALTRDGDTYRPYWDRWARQEERHVSGDEPLRLATHVFEIP
ncbi:hypothetical protein [Microbacterium sp. CFBP9034]|uniref:hypothetical protein n=1 Tax=Microbacterium sp. CFBP9034 TaxID=3096540 RepID=UPI002A6B48AA|nr:hypothetical protein [Microbacterium sp. CFBP9034]MDY0909553.1 hypothetical protein [Microbacterium sp. CFBP9034]